MTLRHRWVENTLTLKETQAALCAKLNNPMRFYSEYKCISGSTETEMESMEVGQAHRCNSQHLPFRESGHPWSNAHSNNELCVYSISKAKQVRNSTKAEGRYWEYAVRRTSRYTEHAD